MEPRGNIYSWAVRSQADDGYTSMKAEPAGTIHTTETRLQRAVEAWGAVWEGGDAYELGLAAPLEPITADAIRTGLRRQVRARPEALTAGGAGRSWRSLADGSASWVC